VKTAVLSLLLILGALPLSAQTWQRLGPEGGMVISLAADQAGNLYLGASDGHIFLSKDRGARWELQGRVGLRTDGVIAQLAADPQAQHRLFAAVWFREVGAGGGVFRSDDGGATWQPAGLQGEVVRALEFAPSEPALLVAGTRSGVFRSNDAGRNWQRISPAGDPELRNVDSVAVDPADPQMIYAGTYHLPWKTTDGGKTWKSIAAGLIDDSDIMSMRVDAANPARIYISACSGIYRSEDRGEVWTKLQGIPYAARRTQAIVQDPQSPHVLYAATTEGLWVTRDAGENWERTTPKEWVVNGVAVLPPKGTSVGRVLIGTEAQGVLASADAGKTFVAANHGFTHPVAKQLAGDPRDAAHLLLLLERNGGELLETRDAGKNWNALPARAGPRAQEKEWSTERIARFQGTPWGWMAELTGGTLWNYSEEAAIWKRWNPGFPAPAKPQKKGSPVTQRARSAASGSRGPLAFSQDDAYLPFPQGLVRCNHLGKCQLLPAFSRAANVSAIWIALDGQTLALASEGKLGISRDAGKTAVWRDLPAGVRGASSILWDRTESSALFLGTDRGLYFSRDAGEHWTLSQGGLPAAVIEGVLRASDRYLVTLVEGGVYSSPEGTGSWTRLDMDAERSQMNGAAETRPGSFVFGSQSEGALLLESHKAP
jgi:photosystem II stability/assembly factor-like uncharacterized protein